MPPYATEKSVDCRSLLLLDTNVHDLSRMNGNQGNGSGEGLLIRSDCRNCYKFIHNRNDGENVQRGKVYCGCQHHPNSKKSVSNVLNQKDRVKCVLVGDGAVGKTSLVVSYSTNGFPTDYVPTAYDNYNVVVNVDGRPIRLQLCDTAGQDDFDSLRPLCYPGTDVYLVCFSVVSPTSFHNVADKWVPEIRRHHQTGCVGSSSPAVVLVGTQSDLRSNIEVLVELARHQETPVPIDEARRLAARIGAVSYVESSALTQHNLKEVFDTAIVHALNRGNQSQGASSASRAEADEEGGGSSFWKWLCCTS
ncbi:cdc42 homolog [Hetaerina americana]|uniref:cdc42 homolog n=1 Tax=Hetaerina americana TaxID=62018 RepID=UPI003A7F2FB3